MGTYVLELLVVESREGTWSRCTAASSTRVVVSDGGDGTTRRLDSGLDRADPVGDPAVVAGLVSKVGEADVEVVVGPLRRLGRVDVGGLDGVLLVLPRQHREPEVDEAVVALGVPPNARRFDRVGVERGRAVGVVLRSKLPNVLL